MIEIDKKEHQFYFLYPLANSITKISSIHRVIIKSNKVKDSLNTLFLTGKPELVHKLFWCRRISFIIIVIFLFNLLSLIGFLTDLSNSKLINENYLIRPSYGQGNSEVKLKVSFQEENNTNVNTKEKLPQSKEVTIDVKERMYTDQEIEKLFTEAIEYLKREVLGNNKSSELVYENLNLVTAIPGTSIVVRWIPQNYALIQSDGMISNEDIEEQGVSTSVTAVLKYNDIEKEQVFTFKIWPKQYSEDELLNKSLVEEIKTYSDNSAEDELLELPVSVKSYRLHWKGIKESSGLTLLLLAVVLAILVWILGDKELEKQIKLRKEQMLLDYPEIINKFTLLVNAGMTMKQAWSKIAEDYNNSKEQKGSIKKYAYEEMLATTYELKVGVPENKAYEQFGRRTGLIPYIRFSSLISQNLKKGTKGFTELLLHEATQAFEDRKEFAKRQGEEAGTKLLMPMMFLLVIVFLIIMIPAFMAFQI